MIWSKDDRKAVDRARLFQELHAELREALSPSVLDAMRLMVMTEMVRNGVPSELAEYVVADKKALTVEFTVDEPG